MARTYDCPVHHIFSTAVNGCYPCSSLCRSSMTECRRWSECDSYREDHMEAGGLPAWGVIVIIVVLLLILLALAVLIAVKFKKRFSKLCKSCCEFPTKAEKRRRKSEGKAMMYPPRIPIQQGYEKAPAMIDAEYSRKRSVMDRFFESIREHPPPIGEDEMEPLRPPKPERCRSRSKQPTNQEEKGKKKDICIECTIDNEKDQLLVKSRGAVERSDSDQNVKLTEVKVSADGKRANCPGDKCPPSESSIPNEVEDKESRESSCNEIPYAESLTLPNREPPSLPVLFAITKHNLDQSNKSKRDSMDYSGMMYPQTTV